MTNPIQEAIKTRRSVRAYQPAPLSDEQVEALAFAAIAAPSARNAQPYSFAVVTDKAVLAEMEADAIKFYTDAWGEEGKARLAGRDDVLFYHAPFVMFIAIDPSSDWAKTDCGIAAQSVSLAASGMGLGSIHIGMARALFDGYGDKWFKRLGFPEGYAFGLAVAAGRANGEGDPHEPDWGKVSYIK